MILRIMKLLVALVVLLVVVVLVVLSVSASWVETAVVTNNQILSGTADLQLSTAGIGGGGWQKNSQTSLLVLNRLAPGAVAANSYYFSLRNNSSSGINFDIFVQITAVTGIEGVDEADLLLNLYENGFDPDMGSYTSGWVSLADLRAAAHSLNSQLAAGGVKDYRLAVRLKETASEAWQGRTIIITLMVTGQQS